MEEFFYLCLDNINLQYLFDQHNLNSIQATWISFLSEYDFEIKHIKGKENRVDDALSRHGNLLLVRSIYEYDLENKILSTRISDKQYQVLKEKKY